MGDALPIRETIRTETVSKLLDFCLLNEAIRSADSTERLQQLGTIIRREIELGYAWTLDQGNIDWLRKEWAARRESIDQQGDRLHLHRPRYVSDRLQVWS